MTAFGEDGLIVGPNEYFGSTHNGWKFSFLNFDQGMFKFLLLNEDPVRDRVHQKCLIDATLEMGEIIERFECFKLLPALFTLHFGRWRTVGDAHYRLLVDGSELMKQLKAKPVMGEEANLSKRYLFHIQAYCFSKPFIFNSEYGLMSIVFKLHEDKFAIVNCDDGFALDYFDEDKQDFYDVPARK